MDIRRAPAPPIRPRRGQAQHRRARSFSCAVALSLLAIAGCSGNESAKTGETAASAATSQRSGADVTNATAAKSTSPVTELAVDPSTTSTTSTSIELTTTTESRVSEATTTTSSPPETTSTVASECVGRQDAISSISVDLDGSTRTAIVHVPLAGRGTPRAVVLSFHGAGDATGRLAEWDGLVDLAEREGFVVVHPQGSPVELFPGLPIDPGWDVMRFGVDDAAFVSLLLDRLAAETCVDAERVFATGLSLGGAAALGVACALGDRIAAVSSVAAFPLHACPESHATPTLIFHGLDDLFQPYAGDPSGMPSAEQMAGDIAIRNGCGPGGPVVTAFSDGIDKLAWSGCVVPVELYRIAANGHAWPGGHVPPFTRDALAEILSSSGGVPAGLTPEQAADNVRLSNPAIDATAIMWEFFAAHAPARTA